MIENKKVCRNCGKRIRTSKPYTIYYHLTHGCGESL